MADVLFAEGHDPLDQQGGQGGNVVRMPQGAAPSDPFYQPNPEEVLGAAFRLNNPVASIADAITRSRPDETPVPNYNPIPKLMGTKYEGLIGQSLTDVNPAQTEARMAKQDSEERDQQIYGASGFAGTVSGVVAGALDPSWFIPLGGELEAAGKGLSIGARLARGAAEGAAKATVSEAGLMSSQVTRTPGEAVQDVATNALLMGILGGAHGFLNPAERAGAERGLEDTRRDLTPGAVATPKVEVTPAENGFTAEALRADGTRASYSVAPAVEGGATAPGAPRSALANVQPYLRDNINATRDVADRMGVTAQIEDLSAQGMNAQQVAAQIARQGVDNTFVREVRASLDIPSMDDHAEYDAWRAAYQARKAGGYVVNRAELDGENPAGGRLAPEGHVAGPNEAPAVFKTLPEAEAFVRQTESAYQPPATTPAGAGMGMAQFNAVEPEIDAGGNPFFKVGEGSGLYGKVKDGVFSVDTATIPEEMQGKGVGLNLYQSAIKWAADRGLTFQSDDHMSASAARVYDALERRGYGVERASDIVDSGERGLATTSGGPVFKVTPPAATLPAGAGMGMAQSVSAAAAEQRDMKMSPILPETITNAIGAIPGGQKAIDLSHWFWSAGAPTRRVFRYGSQAGKLAMGDLAETAVKFVQAVRGITASSAGTIPVNRLSIMDQARYNLANQRAIMRHFIKYRGLEGQPLAQVQAAVQNLRGQAGGKMNLADFKKQVYLASAEGDVHPVPEVEAAAKEARANITQPVADFASTVKGPDGRPMLEDAHAIPAGDQSFPLGGRHINKKAVAADPNGFDRMNVQWLTSEQDAHEAIKERLEPLQERHEKLVDALAKLDGRIATNKQRIVKTEAALKERGMETNRATDRVETLEERNQKIDAGIKELEEFLAETKSEVEAPTADPFDREQYDNLKRDVANLKRSKGRNEIRVNEAGVPVSASEARFMDLADRQTRYQVMQDLLDRARGNADEERIRLRGKMEDEVRSWRGDTSADAIHALKGRAEAERVRGLKQEAGVYEGKGERLTSADSPVDRAVKAMLERPTLTPQEIQARAAEIRNRVNNAPDGRLAYDEPSPGPEQAGFADPDQRRGSLSARNYAIPTRTLLPYLHTDVEHTVASYLRTIIPDLRLTERFGDVHMTETMRKINEEYDAKVRAAEGDQKEINRLDKARKNEIGDLAATRDRIRGTYGLPTTETQRNIGRVTRSVANWNVSAFLGTSMINRFQDMANATARRGMLGYFRDGFLPYITGMARVNPGGLAYRQAMKDAQIGVDTVMGHLASQFWDVVDNHQPGNKLERGLKSAASVAMVVTGHGPWTDMNKQMAAMAAAPDFLRMAARIADRSANERDIRTMAHAGIDPNMARRISENFENGGHTVVGDAKVPNTADWRDQGAARAFEAALQKEADIAVITPGAEKSLFLSDPVLSLFGQFKGFVMSAQERILLTNLQEADGRTLQGVVHMLAMGALSYRLYTLATGQPMSTDPRVILKEAVTRSAMLGWMSDVNQMQAKLFGGKTDFWNLIGAGGPVSRTAALSAPEQLLGPTYTLFSGLAHAMTNASFHNWSAADTHRIRQVMFLQNLMFLRRLFDKLEDGANEYLGVKPAKRWGTGWPGAPAP